jgi:hypothetical protein
MCTQLTPKTAGVVSPEDGRLAPETCRGLRHNRVFVKVKVYYVGSVIVIHNDLRSIKYQVSEIVSGADSLIENIVFSATDADGGAAAAAHDLVRGAGSVVGDVIGGAGAAVHDLNDAGKVDDDVGGGAV